MLLKALFNKFIAPVNLSNVGDCHRQTSGSGEPKQFIIRLSSRKMLIILKAKRKEAGMIRTGLRSGIPPHIDQSLCRCYKSRLA